MAFAVNDVIQVTYWSKLFNQQLMTVLHYRLTTAPTSPLAEHLILSVWATGFTNNLFEPFSSMKACTSNLVLFERVTLQKIKPTRSIYVEDAIAEQGALANVIDTANICASITKRTITSGRKGVGHCQWPPLAQTQMNDGIVDATFRAGALNDFASALTDALTLGAGATEATMNPCLPASSGSDAYDVFDGVPQGTVRTMHRRTVGLGI